jgi:hypothetical protein
MVVVKDNRRRYDLNDEFIYPEPKVLFPYVEGSNEPERASLLPSNLKSTSKLCQNE